MKITEAEMLQRRDRIIFSAFRLFCQRGIERVSVEDIAKRARVSEKSVYRYFNTKPGLVLEVTHTLWKRIACELRSTVEQDFSCMSGVQQLETLLHAFRCLFEKHADDILFSYEYKLYFIRRSTKVQQKAIDDVLAPVKLLYLRALQKGQNDGTITCSFSPEELYTAIWGFMRGYVLKIVLYDRMYEGENFWKRGFESACAILLAGLCPQADGAPQRRTDLAELNSPPTFKEIFY